MQHDEMLSRIIGDIYDAALDADRWPNALRGIACFVGGKTAGLVAKDVLRQHGEVQYHFGCDPHYLQLHKTRYWKFDPLSPLPYFPVGEVTSSRDYMSVAEFQEGRFYREWLRPQGLLDVVSVVLEKSLTSSAILTVIRDEASGPVDEGMRRRMQLIAPHVRRSSLIGNLIDLGKADAASLADTIDGLSAGMFLVDAEGRIVHTNTAGRILLAADDCLSARNGRLAARSAEIDRALRSVFTAAADGDAAVGIGGIALPLQSRSGARSIAHILPLTSGARRQTGIAYTAVAALFVQRVSSDGPSPATIIAQQFGLTPTELRVLLAIVEIGGGPDVAEALGIAESTVKTHLSRLYQKTGATRQVDLVKLLAEFTSPLL